MRMDKYSRRNAAIERVFKIIVERSNRMNLKSTLDVLKRKDRVSAP